MLDENLKKCENGGRISPDALVLIKVNLTAKDLFAGAGWVMVVLVLLWVALFFGYNVFLSSDRSGAGMVVFGTIMMAATYPWLILPSILLFGWRMWVEARAGTSTLWWALIKWGAASLALYFILLFSWMYYRLSLL